jgi:hypothetical protein
MPRKRKPALKVEASGEVVKPAAGLEEATPWVGKVRIIVRRAGYAPVVTELENLVTNAGRNLLAQALRDPSAPAPEITYMSWGSDDTAPTVTDIALGSEYGRKQITSQASVGTGSTLTTTYLGPGDANGSIEELGWWAGDASGVPGSGILVARVLWSKVKDGTESVQVDRTDTIG